MNDLQHATIELPVSGEPVLACGADIKESYMPHMRQPRNHGTTHKDLAYLESYRAFCDGIAGLSSALKC